MSRTIPDFDQPAQQAGFFVSGDRYAIDSNAASKRH